MSVIYHGLWTDGKLLDKALLERFHWLISHLASADGPQGRQVCPWAIQAKREKKFFVGDARAANANVSGISAVVESLVKEYQTLSKFDPSNRLPETLTVLISDEVEGNTIETVPETYRPKLTPQGLMLGALDRFNKLRSLVGGKGFPYAAPWSFLTIRWMVAGDYVFLDRNPAYKEIHNKLFGALAGRVLGDSTSLDEGRTLDIALKKNSLGSNSSS